MTDSHLHSFETDNPKTKAQEFIGIPEYMYDDVASYDFKTLPRWDLQISDYFSEERRSMLYVYDYGDSWKHQIHYEKILFRSSNQKYPMCLYGEHHCPPEDCGGVSGYKDVLIALNDPSHESHGFVKRWIGKKKWDMEAFDPKKVRFTSSQKRKELTFREYFDCV